MSDHEFDVSEETPVCMKCGRLMVRSEMQRSWLCPDQGKVDHGKRPAPEPEIEVPPSEEPEPEVDEDVVELGLPTLCLFCEHLEIDLGRQGEAGFLEARAGEIACLLNIWEFRDGATVTAHTLRAVMLTAIQCEFFEPAVPPVPEQEKQPCPGCHGMGYRKTRERFGGPWRKHTCELCRGSGKVRAEAAAQRGGE